MSAAAAWANTHTATLWPLTTAADWKGAPAFGSPVTFPCDYKAEARTLTNARGQEFTSRLQLYTERADVKPGDRVLVGVSTAADPASVGAAEVMAVIRYADTLDGLADDFLVAT
jgi:hypothetical protein